MKAKSPYLEELRGSMKQGNDGITARMNMKGEIVIEKIPTHYDADTDLQETQRQAFKLAITQWNALSDQEKEEWREKASPYGLTGYQYFISQNISILPTYKVTIDNTGGASLSDYQILISINSDAVFFADCDSKKAAIRIYDSDQTTPLSYWIEEWDIANNNARIWVKVPSIPAGSKKYIYISIDTSRTTDASNGKDVFLFFDDFESSDWANYWEAWYKGDKGTRSTDHAKDGSYSWKLPGGTNPSGIRHDFGSDIAAIVEWWFYDTGDVTDYTFVGGSDEETDTSGPSRVFMGIYTPTSTSKYSYRIASDWYASSITRSNGWHFARLIMTTSRCIGYIDGTQIFNSTNGHHLRNAVMGSLWLNNSVGYGDQFRVRKYADPEPNITK